MPPTGDGAAVDGDSGPADEVGKVGREGVASARPWAASLSRNSTHILEKDSVSSALAVFPLLDDADIDIFRPPPGVPLTLTDL